MTEVGESVTSDNVEWRVEKKNGQVEMTAVDDEVCTYVFDPEGAAMLAAALFDKVEQEEDDL